MPKCLFLNILKNSSPVDICTKHCSFSKVMSKSLYPVGVQFCVRLGCVSKSVAIWGVHFSDGSGSSFLVIFEIMIVGVLFGDETLIYFEACGIAIQ
jgi:hypothetical protein